MCLLENTLTAVIPLIFFFAVIRVLTVSKRNILPETDSDDGVDCDYINVEKKTSSGSGSSRTTILSFNTLNKFKSFLKREKLKKKDLIKDERLSLKAENKLSIKTGENLSFGVASMIGKI